MANLDQLEILKQGVKVWNEWRSINMQVEIDFSGLDFRDTRHRLLNLEGVNLKGADLTGAILYRVNLKGVDLTRANLKEANLQKADLQSANLHQAYLQGANLKETNLKGADLTGAHLSGADLNMAILINVNLTGASLVKTDLDITDLTGANLTNADLTKAAISRTKLIGANLTGAELTQATLVETHIDQAILTDCQIYGLSAWGLSGTPKAHNNLIITKWGDPIITVDDLQLAQFVFLLLNNANIRNVIDTITTKAVLILGRFTEERKAVLDAIRDELRKRNYLPILFDFTGPDSRDITETVSTLAHMARFIIADISDPKSIPQELMHIVPNLPSVPIQPLLLALQDEYAMFSFFRAYPWFLDTYRYEDTASLLSSIEAKVIQPAEDWLAAKKRKTS